MSDLQENNLQVHPLLKKLGVEGAANAISLTGYVGPASHDGNLRLYSSLEDLSNSVEVRREDVLHSAPTPESVLPYGGTIIWLKKDAQVTYHRTEKTVVSAPVETNALEVKQGRLRIRLRGGLRRADCASYCFGGCKPCHSGCTPCH
jgi:hypothetical protein